MNSRHAPRGEYWFSRLGFITLTLVTAVITIGDDQSSNYRSLQAGGGLVTAWILLAATLIGMADCIINDILPARYRFRSARRWRHLVLAVISLCLCAMLFISVKESGFELVQLRFLGQALFIGWLVFLDMFARHAR